MGNCQAVDAATVVIQHAGGGRTELAYFALPAGDVMAANPGHYVAAVITVPQTPAAGAAPKGRATAAAAPVKHLKLLRPDDTLQLGRVYRLVSFEEVLKEFATKRHVKLSRVTVKAKDEEEVAKKKPAKPRRRRGSSRAACPAREESDRSLAKVMRRSKEEEEEEAAAAAAPKPGSDDEHASDPGADEEDDCDLESLLPHGLALGRRMGRQWKPALQSIAEGRD